MNYKVPWPGLAWPNRNGENKMDPGNNEARRTNQERGEDVVEQRGLLRRVQKDTV